MLVRRKQKRCTFNNCNSIVAEYFVISNVCILNVTLLVYYEYRRLKPIHHSRCTTWQVSQRFMYFSLSVHRDFFQTLIPRTSGTNASIFSLRRVSVECVFSFVFDEGKCCAHTIIDVEHYELWN